jgi:hypothetical protein
MKIYPNGKAEGYIIVETVDKFTIMTGREVKTPKAWKEHIETLEETNRYERVFMVQEVEL